MAVVNPIIGQATSPIVQLYVETREKRRTIKEFVTGIFKGQHGNHLVLTRAIRSKEPTDIINYYRNLREATPPHQAVVVNILYYKSIRFLL